MNMKQNWPLFVLGIGADNYDFYNHCINVSKKGFSDLNIVLCIIVDYKKGENSNILCSVSTYE